MLLEAELAEERTRLDRREGRVKSPTYLPMILAHRPGVSQDSRKDSRHWKCARSDLDVEIYFGQN